MEAPATYVTPPSWVLLKVLEYITSLVFDPLHQFSLRDLTRLTFFLVTLASAKRVSELQASFELCPFLLLRLQFRRFRSFWRTQTAVRSLPRTFAIQSLSDFAAGLPDEMLLCPVWALSEYVARTSRFVNRPQRLFVSSCSPSRAMSNNGFSYLLLGVIVHFGASSNDVAAPKAHSIRGIVTSSAFFFFFMTWSLPSMLEAAPGDLIRSSPLFICNMFSTSWKMFAL